MPTRRYSEAQFRAAIADPRVRTMADLCRALGLVPRGANYETLRAFARKLGEDLAGTLRERKDRLGHPPADVAAAVAASRSLAGALRLLGERVHSGNYRRLQAAIRHLALPTDHWTGQGWCTGQTFPERRRPLDDLLVEGRRVSSDYLRRRLIEEGIKEHRCELCGRREWNGRPIPLELDHIDGDRTNNRRDNIRLVCPNCHALTPTYRGRNIGRYG